MNKEAQQYRNLFVATYKAVEFAADLMENDHPLFAGVVLRFARDCILDAYPELRTKYED